MNIVITIDDSTPIPEYGFKVYYKLVDQPSYFPWPVSFFTREITLAGLPNGVYDGIVYSECSPGNFTAPTYWDSE